MCQATLRAVHRALLVLPLSEMLMATTRVEASISQSSTAAVYGMKLVLPCLISVLATEAASVCHNCAQALPRVQCVDCIERALDPVEPVSDVMIQLQPSVLVVSN
eukprot:COSAG02_NODE_1382_length_12967_cov_9.151694_15_plen_105_part_00